MMTKSFEHLLTYHSGCKISPSEIVNGYWYAPHFARQMSKELLWDAIQDRLEKKMIIASYHNKLPLVIYSYARDTQYDKAWDPITMITRGLIMNTETKEVVATPFPKFFNHGEFTGLVPSGMPEVHEKMDGSLGIVFFFEDEWHVATKGSFHSDQAKWAMAWLEERPYMDDSLVPGHTYLTEIVYAENRIVVEYGFEGLVLLAEIDENGYERPYSELQQTYTMLGFTSLANIYDFEEISEIFVHADSHDHNFEGYVLRWPNGYRLKIKGKEYLKVHRIISDFTPRKIWELVRDGGDPIEFKKALPEEFHDEFDLLWMKTKKEEQEFVEAIEVLVKQFANMNDRQLGMKIQEIRCGNSNLKNSAALDFVFSARKKNFIEKSAVVGNKEREKLFREFRP